MKTYQGYPIDLTADEARAALAPGTPIRLEKWRSPWGNDYAGKDWPWTAVLVRYQDKWWELTRTDLKDDVETGRDGASEWVSKDPLGYFRERAQYGARLRNGRFAVINTWSDG